MKEILNAKSAITQR